MIYTGENKAVLCKGDFRPAQLYKGDKKITGYTVEEISAEGNVTLENCYNDKLHNVQIFGNSIQDGTPTPENPIEIQSVGEFVTEGEYAGKYKIPVRARGKNLFDCLNSQKYENNFGYDNALITDRTENTITIQKTMNSDYEFAMFALPDGLEGKTITVYAEWTCSGDNAGMIRVNWDTKLEYSNIIAYSTKSGVAASGVVSEKPANATHLALLLYGGATGNHKIGDEVYYKNIMVTIDEPSTAKPYEPYIEPQTFNLYLDEPLRKFGDYADYVDFNKGVVIKNIQENVYNGNENWKVGTPELTNTYIFGLYENTPKAQPVGVNNHSLCNKFTTRTTGMSSVDLEFVQIYGSHIFIRINKSRVSSSSADEIKNWLSGNPITVNYVLAEPIEEPIELPELPTFKGTTVIEIESDIAAKISGKYKRME